MQNRAQSGRIVELNERRGQLVQHEKCWVLLHNGEKQISSFETKLLAITY
jgi:hypothetical protein